MDKFTKNTNLMAGKGEWEEVEHPRDSDGKFTSKGGDNHKTNSTNNKKCYQTIKILNKKELVQKLMKFEPITLKLNDKTITARFDKYGAKKNVYSIENSDIEGYTYKLQHIDELPNIISSSTFARSSPEKGKDTPQHKGVKEWHYFINKVKSENEEFNVLINIRDKGNDQYVYEVAFNKKT